MFQNIPLDQIHFTCRNPRRDAGEDLEGLATSLGDESQPRLAQLPLVEQTAEGQYRVIAGERRIRAAALRGWQSIACVIAAPLDALEVHHLRLVENLHRRDLHPLDEAAALKIAWLAANADALALESDVRAILADDRPNHDLIGALQALLDGHAFTPTNPPVTWDDLLSGMGVALNRDRRKKLLAVLNIEASLHEQVRSLPLTEAALRALGTLDGETQERLVAALLADPNLARKVRRIARVVRDGSYTLDEALAEARGEVLLPGQDACGVMRDSDEPFDSPAPQPSISPDDPATDAVLKLLDAVNQVSLAVGALAGQPLSAPWDAMVSEALGLLRDELEKFDC